METTPHASRSHLRPLAARRTSNSPSPPRRLFGSYIDAGGHGLDRLWHAAVTFDPLASMGIGYALLSGIEAGRVAHNMVRGSGKLVSAYAQSIASHFARYLELRAAYYRMEQRWPNQPFWSRRH